MMNSANFLIRGHQRDWNGDDWRTVTSYESEGVWPDGWAGKESSFTIVRPDWAKYLRILANKMHHPDHLQLLIDVEGMTVRREILGVGHFVIDLPFGPVEGRMPSAIKVNIRADASYVPAHVGVNGDDQRDLSWIVVAVQGIG